MKRQLTAIKNDEGQLAAPRLGVLRSTLGNDALVSPGESLGVLEILGRDHPLVVPSGVIGSVERLVSMGPVVVEYGQALFGVRPLTGVEAAESLDSATANEEAGHAIEAPIFGIFYVRSEPGADAYVSVGGRVEPGQTLGLIEVMKTFHPVTFDEDKAATVLSLEAEDGQEVEAGRPLIRVRFEP